jgi:hypothetical protein
MIFVRLLRQIQGEYFKQATTAIIHNLSDQFYTNHPSSDDLLTGSSINEPQINKNQTHAFGGN